MEPVKIGLLGMGTVGGGTVNVLSRNAEEIKRRAGRGIQIIQAATRDLTKTRICDTGTIQLTNDPFEVVNNPEIQVIVELIGGTQLAKELILTAIKNGKHVVTANKALIATAGNEIFQAAHDNNVMIAFEAAVAGGIPIIKSIREGLAGNCIQWIAGIINGTGNFILTEMREKGRDFNDVLQEAQELGYAEEDPTFDIEGVDAAHKLTILAAIGFGIPLQFDKVYMEGITKITQEDVTNAENLGYRIKHIGIAKHTSKGIELRVHPAMIPERRLIANVDGVMNAILVMSDAVGPTLYYGAGAGAEPTASSVVADLVDVVRALTTDEQNRVPHLAFQPDALSDLPILPMDRIETAYYLRMRAVDRAGVLADVTRILAKNNISIEAINQQEQGEHDEASVIMLTQRVNEAQINQAIKDIEALDDIRGAITRIRVESLN